MRSLVYDVTLATARAKAKNDLMECEQRFQKLSDRNNVYAQEINALCKLYMRVNEIWQNAPDELEVPF